MWGQLRVARRVDSVHVAESSGDSEATALHRGEGFVYSLDLLRLCVQLRRVNTLVVHTILLAASDSKLRGHV